jgi:hypothetical protein
MAGKIPKRKFQDVLLVIFLLKAGTLRDLYVVISVGRQDSIHRQQEVSRLKA